MQDFQPLLERFLSGKESHLWHRNVRVFLDGDWDAFEGHFESSQADLIATSVRTRQEDPGWYWWSTLKSPLTSAAHVDGVAALTPLLRFSRRAAEAILAGIESGWSGHPEALIPSIVQAAGLKIEDFGGRGEFVAEDRKDAWYNEKTWHWKGPVQFVPGMLHFPVSTASKPLAPGRLAQDDRPLQSPRILFASPVGGEARCLLDGTLDVFLGAGADCLVMQYDNSVLGLPIGVRRIFDRGHKWQLAIRHLPPSLVDDYDYLFLWDDDLVSIRSGSSKLCA
jgi:hypothetical protein